MKKKIISCGVIVIILICVLPLPKIVKRTYFAENNGEKATIELDIKYLNFLLLDDKIIGTVSVTDKNGTIVYGEYLDYVGRWPSNNEDKSLYAWTGWYFNEAMCMQKRGGEELVEDLVGFESAQVFISPDFSKIILQHYASEKLVDAKDKQYMGALEEGRQKELEEYFKGYTLKN